MKKLTDWWDRLPKRARDQIGRFVRIFAFTLFGIWTAQREVTVWSLFAAIPAALDVAYHQWAQERTQAPAKARRHTKAEGA